MRIKCFPPTKITTTTIIPKLNKNTAKKENYGASFPMNITLTIIFQLIFYV